MEDEELPEPALATLERTFERTPKFLEAIAEIEEIGAALSTLGYDQAIHDQGWDHYHASRRRQLATVARNPSTPAAQAISLLDRKDEGIMALTDAALARDHPTQHKHIRQGLKAGTGVGAVISVRTWLERVGELENTEAREGTREQDEAALAALEQVNLGPAERTRLWALVEAAQSITLPTDEARQAAAAQAQAEIERLAALNRLYNWFYKWSRIARAATDKRSHLQKLGLVG